MKKIISVTTGTRAEYGILRPILKKIHNSKNLELILIVTGTHNLKKFGNTVNEIKKDGFKIYSNFTLIPKNDSNYEMAISVGDGIKKFAKIFKKIKPDINLILGDRDESLASAIAAYHMNIPNAHIHGGDKSKAGIDEYNRHAITKISNIHLVATKLSKKRVIKMGENPKFVFLTGSPSIDEVNERYLTSCKKLENKYKINFKDGVIILLQHSVTTETNLSKKQILITLKVLEKLKTQTIVIMPNSDPGSRTIYNEIRKNKIKNKYLKIFSSIPRQDYLGLLKWSSLLIGNSSSGIIEASRFKIPVLNLGIRQEDRERGENVFDEKIFDEKKILKKVNKILKMDKSKFKKSNIYGNGRSSEKIIKILESLEINEQLIQKKIYY